MAIDIACPNCEYKYKLRDDYAGKKVSCKKCLKPFHVPGPVPVGSGPAKPPSSPDTPPVGSNGHAPPTDADALALSALADELPPPEAVAPVGKPIKMKCGGCDHVWEVP